MTTVLSEQQVFVQAGQSAGIGIKFFAPVDAFGAFRKHFDNQAGAGAEVSFPIVGIAAEYQVGVIKALLSGLLDTHFHVIGEKLAALLPCFGTQQEGEGGDYQRVTATGTDHGIDHAINIFVPELTVLLAG